VRRNLPTDVKRSMKGNVQEFVQMALDPVEGNSHSDSHSRSTSTVPELSCCMGYNLSQAHAGDSIGISTVDRFHDDHHGGDDHHHDKCNIRDPEWYAIIEDLHFLFVCYDAGHHDEGHHDDDESSAVVRVWKGKRAPGDRLDGHVSRRCKRCDDFKIEDWRRVEDVCHHDCVCVDADILSSSYWSHHDQVGAASEGKNDDVEGARHHRRGSHYDRFGKKCHKIDFCDCRFPCWSEHHSCTVDVDSQIVIHHKKD